MPNISWQHFIFSLELTSLYLPSFHNGFIILAPRHFRLDLMIQINLSWRRRYFLIIKIKILKPGSFNSKAGNSYTGCPNKNVAVALCNSSATVTFFLRHPVPVSWDAIASKIFNCCPYKSPVSSQHNRNICVIVNIAITYHKPDTQYAGMVPVVQWQF